jgi:hypothetical protein
MRNAAVAALAALALRAGAAPGLELTRIAELPLSANPAYRDLSVQRLGRDGAPWLVLVTESGIRAWRVGDASSAVDSNAGGGSPVFADFDGDGLLDVAFLRGVPSDWETDVAILKGDGAGRFADVASFHVDRQALALSAGDIDGDGRPDLILGASSFPFGDRPELRTYRNRGGFVFGAPVVTSIDAVQVNIGTVVAGDIDGDGRADVVVSGDFQAPVSVWRSRGDGTFALATGFLTGYYPGRAVLADLDGDGRPDLVYRNAIRFPPFTIEAWHNDGAGAFSQLAREDILPNSSDVVVADVNGDGALDLVIAQEQEYRSLVFVSLFAGDGRGSFAPEERWTLPVDANVVPAPWLGAVDWDGDGRTDLVLMTTDLKLAVFSTRLPRSDRAVVPVVLSTSGLLGARFDSDLLLTNSGTTHARATLRYVATAGGGTGEVTRDLGAGQELYAPSALDFLREAGLPIAAGGPLLGTLEVSAPGADVVASVRTTSPTGAGVSYGGVPDRDLLRGPALVPWLVESERDRTNLALVNAGSAADGAVTLRVTLTSGDPKAPGSVDLPDVDLAPGGFFQLGRVLAVAGLGAHVGWAQIARVRGSAPYLAWAAVNDAGTGDGSFVPAVALSRPFASRWIVPSVVQSARYATELVVTNPSEKPQAIRVTLAATGAGFGETLAPGAVFHLPDLFAELRRRGLPGAPAAGAALASALFVDVDPTLGAAVGVRVSASAGPDRFFGVFEPAVDERDTWARSMVVGDLRQDDRTRTNLGIVNLSTEAAFRVDVYDGATGSLAATRSAIRLARGEHFQMDAVLRELAPAVRRGWARVTPDAPARFTCYGVTMDGAAPGTASDDGSFTLGARE